LALLGLLGKLLCSGRTLLRILSHTTPHHTQRDAGLGRGCLGRRLRRRGLWRREASRSDAAACLPACLMGEGGSPASWKFRFLLECGDATNGCSNGPGGDQRVALSSCAAAAAARPFRLRLFFKEPVRARGGGNCAAAAAGGVGATEAWAAGSAAAAYGKPSVLAAGGLALAACARPPLVRVSPPVRASVRARVPLFLSLSV